MMPHKVLVVDDEKYILEETAEALIDEGYECFQANNVDDALAILGEDPEITLVVTDLKMPGKTGADLIKEVQMAFKRDITVIIMSGSLEDLGPDLKKFSFLLKPLGIDEFLEAVETALSMKSD